MYCLLEQLCALLTAVAVVPPLALLPGEIWRVSGRRGGGGEVLITPNTVTLHKLRTI